LPPNFPKPRSGKITRHSLGDIAGHEGHRHLADPTVVAKLKEQYEEE
jgi:hypothetical protein